MSSWLLPTALPPFYQTEAPRELVFCGQCPKPVTSLSPENDARVPRPNKIQQQRQTAFGTVKAWTHLLAHRTLGRAPQSQLSCLLQSGRQLPNLSSPLPPVPPVTPSQPRGNCHSALMPASQFPGLGEGSLAHSTP